MTSATCVLARPLIVASVLDGNQLPGWATEHRDRCLRCQATEARARSTGRSMRRFETVGAGASPPGLADLVVSALEQPDSDSQSAPTVPWFAIAAGAAAVVVFARGRRRR